MPEDLDIDQKDKKWEAPKEERTIEDMGQLKDLLDRASVDHYLLTHQTMDGSARQIMNSDFKGLILNHASVATPKDVIDSFPLLDVKDRAERDTMPGRSKHFTSNSVVILTFPREIAPRVRDIKEAQEDLMVSGVLKSETLPNRLILGYYHDKLFHINPNFDARVPEEWKNLPVSNEGQTKLPSSAKPLIEPSPEIITEDTSATTAETAVSSDQLPPPPPLTSSHPSYDPSHD